MEKIRLLLVDDEEELVYPMSDRLRMRGFDVSTAVNFTDSIKYLENNSFDLALLDIKLPGFSGIDLMKMAFHIQPKIKIILMSGHGSDEDIEECKFKGACDLLIKPVKMDNLIDKINNLLSSNE